MSLEKAEATFDLKAGQELRPEELREAVLDAGFTPRDIFIKARGRTATENGKLIFRPSQSEQTFFVTETSDLAKLKAEGLKEIGLTAKVIGQKPPLLLEIQQHRQ